MGIQGLLPLLKSVTEHVPLSRFKGKLIAVDGNVWIHRGTYACAMELAEGTPTIAYVRFCQKMAELITSLGVRLLIVFDGRSLPAKGPAHQRRREKRRQANQALSAFAELSKEQELSMAPNPGPDPHPSLTLAPSLSPTPTLTRSSAWPRRRTLSASSSSARRRASCSRTARRARATRRT